MKKIVLSILVSTMLLFNVNAQEVFNKGDLQFNLGLGLGATYLSSYSSALIPSINFSGEYGTIPTGEIGLVSFGGMVSAIYSPYYEYVNWIIDETKGHDLGFAFQGRAAWHLHVFNSDKWDVYAGLGSGFRVTSWSRTYYYYDNTSKTETGSYSDFIISEFVGGRMMTSENFGFFAEVGFGGVSTMRIGLTFKM